MCYTWIFNSIQTNDNGYPTFCVQKGILYMHLLPCVPIARTVVNRLEILQMLHDNLTAVDYIISSKLARVTEPYYWPLLRRTIHGYV